MTGLPRLLQQMLCMSCAISAMYHSPDLQASQAPLAELSTSEQTSAHGKVSYHPDIADEGMVLLAGVSMPTVPCHSTAWQIERLHEAPAEIGPSPGSAGEKVQSVRVPDQHIPGPNPFAALALEQGLQEDFAAGTAAGSGNNASSEAIQLQRTRPLPHELARHSSLAARASSREVPSAARGANRAATPAWDVPEGLHTSQRAYSSSWGSDSHKGSAAAAVAELLKLPKLPSDSNGSSTQGTESLDSASALQPPALTFAQLLQQQSERIAADRCFPPQELKQCAALSGNVHLFALLARNPTDPTALKGSCLTTCASISAFCARAVLLLQTFRLRAPHALQWQPWTPHVRQPADIRAEHLAGAVGAGAHGALHGRTACDAAGGDCGRQLTPDRRHAQRSAVRQPRRRAATARRA